MPTTSAADFLPTRLSLTALRKAAAECEGCPLFANATQTVFGEGPARASAMFVGEQPGDAEDVGGRPFIGPAGKLFDRVLAEVGIAREKVYVTNAVKHFKWTPRGKRRMHAKPGLREVAACHPWLEAELSVVHPPVLVCLGATAAQSLLGRTFKLTKQRGQPFASPWSEWTIATYHPSALLRSHDLPGGDDVYQAFVEDMRLVAEQLKS
jgi:uracil-DNA glycosylase family protein